MKKIVHVAAAVIVRPDGSILLGQRAGDTFYSGYWEFPGGKVEAGETPYQALVRELDEELGIRVEAANPWLTREHVYEHAHVSLHFFEVYRWQGEPQMRVHGALKWLQATDFNVGPMLPANGPILKALRLPRIIGITHAAQAGATAQLAALDRALANGLGLVQIREPGLPADALADFASATEARCHTAGALCLLSSRHGTLAGGHADGIHLTARDLMQSTHRPDAEWVGASCHTREELEHAGRLGLDYAMLGHVKPSASHPGKTPLGWARFADLVTNLPIPVFAIGGLTAADMDEARAHGAHGIAMIGGAWQ
jgi:8-oxo-dGTP diphosphatase